MTLVGDIHILFSGWQGYGNFIPSAIETMRPLVGRVDRVVMKTVRTAEFIEFDVLIADPDINAFEQDEDMRVLWSCCVPTKRGESQPSPMVVAAARDQQLIADRCAELLVDYE